MLATAIELMHDSIAKRVGRLIANIISCLRHTGARLGQRRNQRRGGTRSAPELGRQTSCAVQPAGEKPDRTSPPYAPPPVRLLHWLRARKAHAPRRHLQSERMSRHA